ncbi:uncharacterized protein LOC120687515 [Panicum virgatum]|uniref:MATH domain-containing protein n=1 Tax=Panicum virgatum TaxID=38727 RepID=A0A8T0ML38_PANVG|nr:uncharacterized protein LOC120687515 [Panicum virgatum]KAG2537478.1 hypothetical protein PVAP13_9NG300000 [Panicum virgatum]
MGNSSSRGRSKLGQGHGSKVAPSSPAAEQTIFKWSIDGFSSLLDKGAGWTYSRVFEAMAHNWCLKLNPRDKKSGDDKEYVSLRLELANSSVKPDTVVNASFKLLIYDQSFGKHSEHEVSHSFQTASTSSGISCMISLRKLKKQSPKFLLSNCCVFGVEFLKVTTSKANTTSETLFVQKVSIFNEAKTYTWDIDDFFALKNPGYSPEFEVGGYKWNIIMYPSCDGNHLSLYLKLKKTNDQPKDTANLVELTLYIKDQETDKHRKGTGRCQFAKNSRTWGWSKFISLEDFKDSANGYLVKTKCCVVAEVAIVGSSKME